jgi:hypothetical protein
LDSCIVFLLLLFLFSFWLSLMPYWPDPCLPGSREPKALPSSGLTADPSWPAPATAAALGQLSGVSIDTYGNAVIFHRGDRTWTGQTFNK